MDSKSGKELKRGISMGGKAFTGKTRKKGSSTDEKMKRFADKEDDTEMPMDEEMDEDAEVEEEDAPPPKSKDPKKRAARRQMFIQHMLNKSQPRKR